MDLWAIVAFSSFPTHSFGFPAFISLYWWPFFIHSSGRPARLPFDCRSSSRLGALGIGFSHWSKKLRFLKTFSVFLIVLMEFLS